jgi:hypothetical protein
VSSKTDQTPDFLLPNYNKCKNSDTLSDHRRSRVQQNGFKRIAADRPVAHTTAARGRFIYLNNFSGLPLIRW